MYFIPSQPDHVIINHWVKTGVISLALFLLNWIILFLSALVMFRIKKLHYHANTDQTGAKLAQFSAMVDDPSYSQLPPNGLSSATLTETGYEATLAMLGGGKSTTTISTTTTSSRKGMNLPLLSSTESVVGVPLSLPKSGRNVMINRQSGSLQRENSGAKLKSASTKGAYTKQYDFATPTKESHSSQQLLSTVPGLVQSAESAAVYSKEDEQKIVNNPLQLRKGSVTDT